MTKDLPQFDGSELGNINKVLRRNAHEISLGYARLSTEPFHGSVYEKMADGGIAHAAVFVLAYARMFALLTNGYDTGLPPLAASIKALEAARASLDD